MRIVAGNRRGLTLEAPGGRTTRPTTDRARESLFNILSGPKHLHRLRDRPVADFFAGTGAVGLEALSRGASHCSFLETDPEAQRILAQNIKKARYEALSRVLRQSATKPPPSKQACGLLFFDPPYHEDVAAESVTAALTQGWLAEDGLIVVQLHPKAPFTVPDGLELVDDRRYGATRFLFLEPAA